MANDFVIRISADDKATAVVKKIQAALGKITEPVEKANKRVSSLGNVGTAGLAKLRKGMDGVASSASKVVDKIVEIIPGLTAIGGAASLAGLSALAVKFGNFGFGLNKSSQLLGMNAQDLAAWHVAAKRAGVSAEEFDSSMAGSQGAIRGAAFGADPHAMMMLQKMGVQIQHNKDGSIDYLSTQQKIMTALANQPSVQGQRDAANVLGMGALLPMIQQGTYAADKARAMRKGLVPTPEEIARATAFHQNINDLEDSVTGLGNSIGSRLIPILDPLVRGFSAWLDRNRVQVADAIAGAVQRFAEWIKSINWGEVVSQMKSLFDAMGGIKGVAIALAVITFASPIAGLLSMITSLTTLATTAIPAAVLGFTGLGLAAAAAAAAYTINKIKDSTEPGHFVGRNAGAPIANPLRPEDTNQALWDRMVQGAKDFVSTPTGRFVPRNAAAQAPLGIRTNNPLNILTRGSQNNYATPEEGIAAAAANLQKNYRGLSLAGIADKWTGGARTGNSPEQIANYVGILSRGTGLSASQTPDLNNSSVVAALLKAQIRAENGEQPYGDAQIANGISRGMGGAAAGASAPATAGAPQINVTVHNALPGTHVETKSSDGGYLPTKVNYALRGADGAAP
jgi:hypothetical protein